MLKELLKGERRAFAYREKTLFGFIGNTIGLIRPGMVMTGRGMLATLFILLASGNARHKIMMYKHGGAR